MALKIAIQMAPVAAIDIKIAYNLATDFATLAGHVRRGLAVCCLQSPQLTLCHQQASNNQLVAIVAGFVERGVGALCVCKCKLWWWQRGEQSRGHITQASTLLRTSVRGGEGGGTCNERLTFLAWPVLGSAPLASSSSMIATSPLYAAACRAVRPLSLVCRGWT